jgi:acyl-CoA reductase-like NAD-dependent aldehyde dehydrogenase
MITETDEVERAIDDAAKVWPELRDDRAALLRRIIDRGAEAVHDGAVAGISERRRAIRETAGMFQGMYPPGEAARLKDEWPA